MLALERYRHNLHFQWIVYIKEFILRIANIFLIIFALGYSWESFGSHDQWKAGVMYSGILNTVVHPIDC
jgi:hypothetical protein